MKHPEKETDMTSKRKSVALISHHQEITDKIGAVLRSLPNIEFTAHSSTLTAMNGTAVKIAGSHDLVIFYTEAASENDIRAIKTIRDQLGAEAIILALSPGETSLAEAKRLNEAGVNDILIDTITPAEMQEEIVRNTAPSAPVEVQAEHASEKNGKVISISHARGGAGSTTLAINLADNLQKRKGRRKTVPLNRVALIDFDLQFGAVSGFIDVAPTNALFQMAMEGTVPDARFILEAMTTLDSGLSVLPAPIQFAPMESLQAAQVETMLKILKSEFDYVVIDLPVTLVDWISPVLNASDKFLIVTDITVPAVRQARRLIDFYMDEHLGLDIDIVVNREKKPMIKARHHTEAARVLERPLKYWLPDDPKVAREALDRGVPFSALSGRSIAAKAIAKVSQTISDELDQIDALQNSTVSKG